MGRDWIIDVLADLRRFARENDMPRLTAQLEEARLVAEVEIASFPEHAAPATPPHSDPETGRRVSARLGLPRRT